MVLSVNVLCAKRSRRWQGREEGKVLDMSLKLGVLCVTYTCAATKIANAFISIIQTQGTGNNVKSCHIIITLAMLAWFLQNYCECFVFTCNLYGMWSSYLLVVSALCILYLDVCGWLVLHLFCMWMHRALILLMWLVSAPLVLCILYVDAQSSHLLLWLVSAPLVVCIMCSQVKTWLIEQFVSKKKKYIYIIACYTCAAVFLLECFVFPFLLVLNCCSFSCFNVFPPVVFPFFACTWGVE